MKDFADRRLLVTGQSDSPRLAEGLNFVASRHWPKGVRVRLGADFEKALPSPVGARERSPMAQVAKVITIIGSSPESFAKAADAAVQEASKTLRGITGAHVESMSAVVENERISEYRTTVNIAFALER
jgi:hypothetical protein